MQQTSDVFEAAVTILQFRGEAKSNLNPRYLRSVYRDDKLEITAYIDITDQAFKEISIRLFMPQGKSSTTLVYAWDRLARQYRPGRWTTYLRNITREIIAESTSIRLKPLESEPIDDREIFPDMGQ